MERMFRNLFIASVLSGSACAELFATFSQGDAKDVRMDRIPALSVVDGQPPTPFPNAGGFGVE